MKELLKELLLRPGLWMAAVLVTAGVSVGAYVVNGGAMFSPGELSDQARRKVPRGGVNAHADLSSNCAACHAPPVAGGTMAERCLDCHTNVRDQLIAKGPMHGKISNGESCRDCHTEHRGPHANLTSFVGFNHDWTAFKLTGHHCKISDCSACHKEELYQGTPQSCVSCHAEPAVHKGRFGANCQQCHSTETWVLASGNGVKLANFDHDSTGFKLTGKHASVDCRQCHVKDTFKGTPKSCVSCHAEPTVHKDRFGKACADCHTTSAWTGAIFKHTVFPVTHRGKNNTCAKCHNDANNFVSYTCYNCHAHTPARELARHSRRKITDVDNCIKCHARDKGRRVAQADLLDDGACPQLAGHMTPDHSLNLAWLAPLTAKKQPAQVVAEPLRRTDLLSRSGLPRIELLGAPSPDMLSVIAKR